MTFIIVVLIVIGIFFSIFFFKKGNKKSYTSKNFEFEESNFSDYLNDKILEKERLLNAGKLFKQKMEDIVEMLESDDLDRQTKGITAAKELAEEVLTKEKNGIRTGAAPEVINNLRKLYPEFA